MEPRKCRKIHLTRRGLTFCDKVTKFLNGGCERVQLVFATNSMGDDVVVVGEGFTRASSEKGPCRFPLFDEFDAPNILFETFIFLPLIRWFIFCADVQDLTGEQFSNDHPNFQNNCAATVIRRARVDEWLCPHAYLNVQPTEVASPDSEYKPNKHGKCLIIF